MLTTKDKYLYKDGKRFFYLADTCWGAFGSIDMPDWRYYLDSRKAAGFNTIQINVLRQWDSSLPIREPFAITNHMILIKLMNHTLTMQLRCWKKCKKEIWFRL